MEDKVSVVESLLSIVICTHNRPSDLRELLSSLKAEPAFEQVPTVVVDSASRPEVAASVVALCQNCTNVRYERVERPGLSRARNRGVHLAETPWVAFLDDDAVVSPGWLRAAREIALHSPSDVGAVGGRILPRWPGEAPVHIGERWLMFLSCINVLEQEGGRLIPECYGANLMMHRESIARAGFFPEDLGRTGSVLLSGEESVLLQNMVARGLRILYNSGLVVQHKIEPVRLTREWIRDRAFWGGVTEEAATIKMQVRATHLNVLKLIASLPLLRFLSLLRDPFSDYYIRYWYAVGVVASRARRVRRAGVSNLRRTLGGSWFSE